MRHLPKIFFCLLLFILIPFLIVSADTGRWEKEISGKGWKLWLDRDAEWINDDIYLPPVNIDELPVNQPTCGWEKLERNFDKIVNVPGTVEEHFWSRNDNPNGIAGDFRGVSWWSTKFKLEPELEGKRIIIAFESVNLRAEVFVNRKLAGYDVIGNTPFEIDITDTVSLDRENFLDIRITDPVGTFSWNDENLLHWGKNRVPSVHGFGGITGKIFLRAVDEVAITDVYVQNQPEPKKVKIFINIENKSGKPQSGNLSLEIQEWENPSNVVWRKTITASVSPEGGEFTFSADVKKARLWDIRSPNLYIASAAFTSGDGNISDNIKRRFGFRWFDVGEKDGDKRYYLNGKRVFIIAAMTRGFWPKNGMFPTPEYARKDMETALSLGYNMMLYHRAIGQPLSIETADEMGVLTYEEPGGYLCRPAPDETAQRWRKEKLRRMVIRDRSHPSMVIFNIDDLSFAEPNDYDKENMSMVHSLDPSRIVTYNCIIRPKIPNYQNDPMKLHMLPYDSTFHYHGWTSPYHLIRYGGYLDEYYRNPRYYLRYVIDPVADMGDSLYPLEKDEIIFLGEEGALGALVRLEKIKNELLRSGADGWRENEHLDWYSSFDRFLDESGFRSSYPTVDDLTLALGKNAHYFQGRILENSRISNKVDSYVINGWASASTRTDIVDTYRNPTADPSILRYYTQPLYIAVKLRDKVLPTGAFTSADIYIVNEKNLKGKHKLALSFVEPDNNEVFSSSYDVKVLGGEEFGQLLVEEVRLPDVLKPGYYNLKAELLDRKGEVKAKGFDDIFVADLTSGPGFSVKTAVIDTSGAINAFLEKVRGVTLLEYNLQNPDIDCLVIGAHDYRKVRRLGVEKNTRPMDPIMDRVANGMTLVILDQAESWANQMTGFDYTSVKYKGSEHWGNKGRFFAGKSELLHGLPVEQSLGWECQVFYRGDVWGLRFAPQGVETIVGLAAEHRDEVLNALSRVRFGNGQIIITTLRILGELSSDRLQSAAAKKLFLNLLEYSN